LTYGRDYCIHMVYYMVYVGTISPFLFYKQQTNYKKHHTIGQILNI